MNTRIGMNTSTAQSVAATISGLGAGLDLIEQQVRMARTASLNPLNFMINPGSLVLSPASIGIALSATTDISNARAQLDYLVLKLQQETLQQEQVSGSLVPTDTGWFAAAPNASKPDEITMGDQLWEDFGVFTNVAGYVMTIESIVETGIEAADALWRNAPPWVREAANVVDTLKLGKWIPFVGMPIAWAGVATDWDEDYVWGNTRNIIGASIATLEVIALIPPLTPAAPIVGAVGLVWDVFDTVWDIGDEYWW